MGLDMEIMHNGVDVIYMRKKNAIRRWFAENLEDFNDNGTTNLPKEKFEELLDTMWRLIDEGGIKEFYNRYIEHERNGSKEDWDKIFAEWKDFVVNGGERYEHFCDKANEIFAPSSGFFFGSTGYDEYFIDQIIVYFDKFKRFYDEMITSGEEWEEGTVEYWEWY